MSPLLKKNKQITFTNKQIFLFLIISCFFVSAMTTISSGILFKVQYAGEEFRFWNPISKFCFQMVIDLYDMSYLEGIRDILSITVGSGGVGGGYAALYSIARNISNSLISAGTILLTLYFFLELFEKTQMDNFNFEHFIKLFGKYLLGIGIMSNMMDLLLNGISFGNAILNNVTSTINTDEATLETVRSIYNSDFSGLKNVIGAWSSVLKYFFPWISSLITKVVVYFCAFGRIIELFARTAFAPIAMANIFSGGVNSSGFRYFKKIVAVALQGAIIIVVAALSTSLSGIISSEVLGGNVFSQQVGQLVLMFTTASLVIKTQGIANDILGV